MLTKKIVISFGVAMMILGCAGSDSNSPKEEPTQKTTFFPTQNKALATQQSEATVFMEARLAGVLEKDKNGCLRVNGDLIIWPYGSTLKDNLIYDKNGNPIAEIGESIVLGGGGMSSDENSEEDIKRISEQLPNPQCRDPYFFVGSVI